MEIGIVGAGAAGLAALRHSLAQGHKCVVFEQTDKIGGTWNLTDLTVVDQYGLPIHSSMYQGLKTNLPKELMEYEDFFYEGIDTSFITQKEVLEYMEKFAEHYNLLRHIKFLSHVIEISPLAKQKWRLKEKCLKTNCRTEYTFDAVMICVGNYSVAKMPNIPGMELLGSRAIHSHHYRKPDPYMGKKVLVIGAGPSGTDIARIVGAVAEKVFLSHGENFFFQVPNFVIHKPLVQKFEDGKAIFEDDSEEDFDNIIYCTGYQYCYPFLTEDCAIFVDDNWVKYLFKHVINVNHPTMGLIGITFKVCPFPTFDIQRRNDSGYSQGRSRKVGSSPSSPQNWNAVAPSLFR
ncbi:uncharacterized protein [Euwallacea fornicatus]|uniref:uncharacterized protein isoform X4 n=1 Tax=Euwallacea fornicatus TaxID=995702 RepID=UPI00338FA994